MPRKVLKIKFDRDADKGMTGNTPSGDYQLDKTIQEERVRRQIASKRSPKPGAAPKK